MSRNTLLTEAMDYYQATTGRTRQEMARLLLSMPMTLEVIIQDIIARWTEKGQP